MKTGLVLIVVSLILSSCVTVASAPPATPTVSPCDTEQVKAAGAQMSKIFERWQDAVNIASSTSRVSLSGPVGDLQTIRRDAKDLSVPICLAKAQKSLTDSMDSVIEGFLAFMSQKPDSVVSPKFDAAKVYLASYSDEVQRVTACAPNCD